MDEATFKARTRQLGLDVIELVVGLPKSEAGAVLGRQLLRAATSAGANYRAACRAKSTADIVAKLAIVEAEADETVYWLDLLHASGVTRSIEVNRLVTETNEIVAMTVASIRTLKARAITTNPKSNIQNPQS